MFIYLTRTNLLILKHVRPQLFLKKDWNLLLLPSSKQCKLSEWRIRAGKEGDEEEMKAVENKGRVMKTHVYISPFLDYCIGLLVSNR